MRFTVSQGTSHQEIALSAINDWLKPLPDILKSKVHAKCSFAQIKIDSIGAELDPLEYEKLLLHMENLGRQPGLLKQQITKENKEAFRPILQWLGGYLVKKVDRGIWYKEIVRRVERLQNQDIAYCLIGGLRFKPNDSWNKPGYTNYFKDIGIYQLQICNYSKKLLFGWPNL